MASYRPPSDPKNLDEGRNRRAPYHRHRMVGEVTGFPHIVRVEAPIDPVTADYRIARRAIEDTDRLLREPEEAEALARLPK